MPFITTAIHAASIRDDEKITFTEYYNHETSSNFVKVIYVSDEEEFINVFNENFGPLPEYLQRIYDYCKTNSSVTYVDECNLYALTGCNLFKNHRRNTLMVSDKNIIGTIVDDIYHDASDTLSLDAENFYKNIYFEFYISKNL